MRLSHQQWSRASKIVSLESVRTFSYHLMEQKDWLKSIRMWDGNLGRSGNALIGKEAPTKCSCGLKLSSKTLSQGSHSLHQIQPTEQLDVGVEKRSNSIESRHCPFRMMLQWSREVGSSTWKSRWENKKVQVVLWENPKWEKEVGEKQRKKRCKIIKRYLLGKRRGKKSYWRK